MQDTLSATNFLRDHKEETIYTHQVIYNKQVAKLTLDSLNVRIQELLNDPRKESNKIYQVNITGVIIYNEDEE